MMPTILILELKRYLTGHVLALDLGGDDSTALCKKTSRFLYLTSRWGVTSAER